MAVVSSVFSACALEVFSPSVLALCSWFPYSLQNYITVCLRTISTWMSNWHFRFDVAWTPDLPLTSRSTLPLWPSPILPGLDQKPWRHPWSPHFVFSIHHITFLLFLQNVFITQPLLTTSATDPGQSYHLYHIACSSSRLVSVVQLQPLYRPFSTQQPKCCCFLNHVITLLKILQRFPVSFRAMIYCTLSSAAHLPFSAPFLGNSSPISVSLAHTHLQLHWSPRSVSHTPWRPLSHLCTVSCLWNALCQLLQDVSHHLLSALLNSDISLSGDFLKLFQNKTKQTPHSLTASITYALLSCLIFHDSTSGSQMWGQGFCCVYCSLSSS